jgi:ribosome-binding factor A
MSRRTERLSSLLQEELAQIIQRELTDPRISPLTSVTRVKVADDLSAADVYLTIMGTVGQQTAGLNAIRHSAGLMRAKLTKVLTIRQVPYLKFHLDEQLKKELEVMDLLRRVETEKAEMEERAAREAERLAEEQAEAARKAAAREAAELAREAGEHAPEVGEHAPEVGELASESGRQAAELGEDKVAGNPEDIAK